MASSETRPNYFVAVPIANAKLREEIDRVQKEFLQENPELVGCETSTIKSHFTLLVLYLNDNDDNEVQKAKRALSNAKVKVLEYLKGRSHKVRINHVDHFDERVLFASIGNEDELRELKEIRNIVNKEFARYNLGDIRDGPTGAHDWNAHITLFKTRYSAKDNIETETVEHYKQKYFNHNFGEETLSVLQLCAMDKDVQPSGYFHVSAVESLSSNTF